MSFPPQQDTYYCTFVYIRLSLPVQRQTSLINNVDFLSSLLFSLLSPAPSPLLLLPSCCHKLHPAILGSLPTITSSLLAVADSFPAVTGSISADFDSFCGIDGSIRTIVGWFLSTTAWFLNTILCLTSVICRSPVVTAFGRGSQMHANGPDNSAQDRLSDGKGELSD